MNIMLKVIYLTLNRYVNTVKNKKICIRITIKYYILKKNLLS